MTICVHFRVHFTFHIGIQLNVKCTTQFREKMHFYHWQRYLHPNLKIILFFPFMKQLALRLIQFFRIFVLLRFYLTFFPSIPSTINFNSILYRMLLYSKIWQFKSHNPGKMKII